MISPLTKLKFSTRCVRDVRPPAHLFETVFYNPFQIILCNVEQRRAPGLVSNRQTKLKNFKEAEKAMCVSAVRVSIVR